MEKFKIGDKVKVICADYLMCEPGATGIVKGFSKRGYCAVEFDCPNDTFHNCGGLTEHERGQWVHASAIELIKTTAKKNYIVTIEETISQEFDIEAESLDEALEIARKKYYDGEIVVYPESPIYVEAYARTEDRFEATSWREI